jgi:hypothetical protein
MASGHAVTVINGAERSISFSAVLESDGSVSGQARLDSEATGLSFVLELNCLVITGGLARIGGEVTQSSSPALIGANVIFHAEDNGQVPTDAADRISSAFITGSTCAAFVIPSGHPGSLRPIDRGAIRVSE